MDHLIVSMALDTSSEVVLCTIDQYHRLFGDPANQRPLDIFGAVFMRRFKQLLSCEFRSREYENLCSLTLKDATVNNFESNFRKHAAQAGVNLGA